MILPQFKLNSFDDFEKFLLKEQMIFETERLRNVWDLLEKQYKTPITLEKISTDIEFLKHKEIPLLICGYFTIRANYFLLDKKTVNNLSTSDTPNNFFGIKTKVLEPETSSNSFSNNEKTKTENEECTTIPIRDTF